MRGTTLAEGMCLYCAVISRSKYDTQIQMKEKSYFSSHLISGVKDMKKFACLLTCYCLSFKQTDESNASITRTCHSHEDDI